MLSFPPCSPNHCSRCALIIPALAEESADHESNCTAELKLYSDGSGTEGGAGAAAALYKDGNEPRVLTYHLGTLEDHMIFKAEAIGLSLALHMICLERDVGSVAIQLDNQAVIKSLKYHTISLSPPSTLLIFCYFRSKISCSMLVTQIL